MSLTDYYKDDVMQLLRAHLENKIPPEGMYHDRINRALGKVAGDNAGWT